MGSGEDATAAGEPADTVRVTNETACAVHAAAAAHTDTWNAYQAFIAIENGKPGLRWGFPFEGKIQDVTHI
jgi:hypothetical protein